MPDEKENSEVTTQSEIKREKVRVIPIRYIDDFPEHPFKVKDDEEMTKLIESVSLYGVMTPVVARIKEDGRYELISGHRRKFACQKLGIDELPIIVRNMTREEAVISMVDLNLQREHILPSEKAFAYKMKMEALRKKSGRPSKDNLTPVVSDLRTDEMIGAENNESREQVRRYIRLTELTPELLEMVDEGRIAFRPAVDLSYLREEEMRDLVETIDSEDCTPSMAQAIMMKNLSAEDKLDMDKIFEIMTQEKANQKEKIKIPMERIQQFFLRGTPQQKIEDTIIKALEVYQRFLEKKKDKEAR